MIHWRTHYCLRMGDTWLRWQGLIVDSDNSNWSRILQRVQKNDVRKGAYLFLPQRFKKNSAVLSAKLPWYLWKNMTWHLLSCNKTRPWYTACISIKDLYRNKIYYLLLWWLVHIYVECVAKTKHNTYFYVWMQFKLELWKMINSNLFQNLLYM